MKLLSVLFKITLTILSYTLLFACHGLLFLIDMIDDDTPPDDSDDLYGNHYDHLSGDIDSVKRSDGIYTSDTSEDNDPRF